MSPDTPRLGPREKTKQLYLPLALENEPDRLSR